jgi:DNA-binding transcriptional LysR family regulator
MSLRRFNLNLLTVLDALLDCRNVTRAGERLGLSQPATSAALAKLRDAFHDELLVMVGRELQLTPKAEELREPVKQLLRILEATFERREFDPQNWSDEFIIATADYISVLVLPPLLKAIAEIAPDLTVRFTNITRTSATNLKNDEIDMIIAPMELINDPMLMSRHLFTDRFVVGRHRDTPSEPGRELDGYLGERHILTLIDTLQPGARRSNFRKEIDDLREAQKNLAIVPYYLALPFFLSELPYRALMQERLARKMMEYLPIAYDDPPVELPALDFAMFWNPRVNRDASHRWMRDMIANVCQGLA